MTTDLWSLLAALLLGLVWLRYTWQQRHAQEAAAAKQGTGWRLLRPRTPDDCPVCCQQTAATSPSHACRPVRPWHEVKSRRGAPKRIATAGFACPNRQCAYYQISDAQVHALVGDGTHGKGTRIQTFRCQACGATFSARRHTPLYRLTPPAQRVGEVLTALAEGLDIAAAGRVFGHSEGTLRRWVSRAGSHSATLHAHWFRGLCLPHLQLDELRTRLRRRTHTLWLWLAVDPLTKLIPVLYLGPRTQASAHRVVHDLRQRLAPDCLPVFTSDGLNHYFYALTAHFGHWVAAPGRRARQWQAMLGLCYGQVKKTYRCRRVVRVIHQMRCGTPAELKAALHGLGLSGRLNTAFVERVNLTIRQSVAALVRRTWATAQEAPHLLAHLEWWRGYYHFVRPHASLRVALAQPQERGGQRIPQRYRQRTPAMAAGLTSRRWTVRDLLAVPLPPDPGGAA